jgi:hypothetical protein
LATTDDASLDIAHPQQALEIVDLTARRADHWLERKQQTMMAQCVLHFRAYR